MKCSSAICLVLAIFTTISPATAAPTSEWDVPEDDPMAVDSAYNVARFGGFSSEDVRRAAMSERKRAKVEGRVLVVDTRDQATCQKIKAQIPDVICEGDPAHPYTSVVFWKESDQTPFESLLNHTLTSSERDIYTESRNILLVGLVAFGALYVMPESISQWHNKDGSLTDKWETNIKAGPVWDNDKWYINYIGHPLAGAGYHMAARRLGYSPMQSFAFSAFMSTFFWEYGLEAFAEVPSIQDLILTPVMGSLLGELFLGWIEEIKANDGKLAGSQTVGSAAIVMLDPVGALANEINEKFEAKIIKSASGGLYSPYDWCRRHLMRTGSRNEFDCGARDSIGLMLHLGF